MSCLAGVGGRVKSIMATVQGAPRLLVIDGCPLECGANSLRLAGIVQFEHLKLHEHGIRKHSVDANDETITAVVEAAGKLLGAGDSPVTTAL